VRRVLLQSPAFSRDLRKWLKSRPRAAAGIEAALQQLSADAGEASLHTHKLQGPLAGFWGCSAGYDLRIVFEYGKHEGVEAIVLLAVGTHDEVY
jgi:addiction module RelE/StbE family toxin